MQLVGLGNNAVGRIVRVPLAWRREGVDEACQAHRPRRHAPASYRPLPVLLLAQHRLNVGNVATDARSPIEVPNWLLPDRRSAGQHYGVVQPRVLLVVPVLLGPLGKRAIEWFDLTLGRRHRPASPLRGDSRGSAPTVVLALAPRRTLQITRSPTAIQVSLTGLTPTAPQPRVDVHLEELPTQAGHPEATAVDPALNIGWRRLATISGAIGEQLTVPLPASVQPLRIVVREVENLTFDAPSDAEHELRDRVPFLDVIPLG